MSKKIAVKKKRVLKERTHNGKTMTESAYFQMIRQALRQKFRYWKPLCNAKELASRKYMGPEKLQKKEYLCAMCKKWFKGSQVQVDHIIPCGSLKSLEDIAGFVQRLTTENINDYQVLCLQCHIEKTAADKVKIDPKN